MDLLFLYLQQHIMPSFGPWSSTSWMLIGCSEFQYLLFWVLPCIWRWNQALSLKKITLFNTHSQKQTLAHGSQGCNWWAMNYWNLYGLSSKSCVELYEEWSEILDSYTRNQSDFWWKFSSLASILSNLSSMKIQQFL